MYNIAICIPTYKRPLMLRKLLLSILDINIDNEIINKIQLIIVDNDTDKTAENIIIELQKSLLAKYTLYYFSYPNKGLSNIRNELLRRAYILQPDFIAFIDDDEYVAPEWLNELVRTICVNKSDMAMGIVIPVFNYKVSKYLSCWFERPNYPNYTRLYFSATNNLLIRTNSLLKNDIWFDDRFNFTGGEDVYLGEQMLKKGAIIHWAANAIVYETNPASRDIKWLIKRRYNSAIIYTSILKLEKKYFQLLRKSMISIFYLIAGICSLIVLLIPIKKKFWGIIKLSEGTGGLAALFNVKYYEYK